SSNVPALPQPTIRASGKRIVLEQPGVETVISAGGPTALTVSPDLYRAELVRALLMGELGSQTGLNAALRERLGATYWVNVTLASMDANTKYLLIRTLVANDKAASGIAALLAEYSRFLAEGVPDNELEAFKSAFIS